MAEAVHAVRVEHARDLADVLLRRTRLGLTAARTLTADGGAVSRAVAETIAPDLGWDRAGVAAAVEEFLAVARKEGLVPGSHGPADGA